ncbi:phosphomannose isomerase type II C-terminal cupin domain [Candidatus Woesearchaeota archaeon]|nr:phosphomannose isomerase type II C-terminal cupin domain [Candidatus Woesearchaeota archaeon]
MDKVLEKRPWGEFRQFAHNEICTVKIITILPGGVLSKQYHHHRDEFWVMLDDGIKVEIGDTATAAKKDEEFFIPKGTVHRVSSEQGGRFLEIAFGDFDEKDIVRIDDRYGRA